MRKNTTKKELKDFHEHHIDQYQGNWASSVILKISRRYLGKRILDAGAGDGALIKLIKRKYPSKRIIGVDLKGDKKNKIVK